MDEFFSIADLCVRFHCRATSSQFEDMIFSLCSAMGGTLWTTMHTFLLGFTWLICGLVSLQGNSQFLGAHPLNHFTAIPTANSVLTSPWSLGIWVQGPPGQLQRLQTSPVFGVLPKTHTAAEKEQYISS